MRSPDEQGFTLVELIVAVAILGIVVGAIGSAMIVGLRTTDGTNTRLSESHDTQISTAYFSGDAQSADNVAKDITDPCAGVGAMAAVRFSWTDPVDTSTTVTKTAAYVVSTSAAGRELHRRYCEDSSLRSDVVVSHNLHLSINPVVACDSDTASNTDCIVPGGKQTVTITITDASAYSYTLFGYRRTT